MSTHATIAYTDGARCSAIYLHADGSLSYAGAMLLQNYNTKELAGALVALGDLSMLKKRLAPSKGEPHSFENKAKDVTVAYCRDRDELLNIRHYADTAISNARSFFMRLAEMSGANYVYLFDEQKNQWLAGAAFKFTDREKEAFPAAELKTFYPLKTWFE